MKIVNIYTCLLCALMLSCTGKGGQERPEAKHVILIGLDAMSARGVQRAVTPNLNRLIDQGAVSMQARCIRPTSSSQNWMSMVSGATPEMHGVTDNDWEPDNRVIPPALQNKKGLFPTIFDDIKAQRPDAKVYLYYEWTEQDRMYDVSVADRAVTGFSYDETLTQAIEAFFADKPEFLFVSINQPDHVGHESGHESREYLDCITHFDTMIGALADRLQESGMLDETILIITADHGGLGKSHGGDSEAELEIPILLYGGTVTKGKVMERTNLICDIAATVGGLLGVSLPDECAGSFITEAFEPLTEKVYVPMPYITPTNGFFREATEVTITADVADATLYYTLDGSLPTNRSARYEAPFMLDKPALIHAVAYRNGQAGRIAQAQVRVVPAGGSPQVAYRYYENVSGSSVPDFSKLGRPTREGYVYEFTLDELDVEEKDHFGVLFTTNLQIDKAGMYRFGVISDDGSLVYVDDRLVIDNDGSHAADMKLGGIELGEGMHKLRVAYFEDYMGQKLELYYASDLLPLQMIPFSRFSK